MRMLRFFATAGCCLSLIAASSTVYAATIFTDFGPGYSYTEGIGWTISGTGSGVGANSAASAFSSPFTADVTQIDIGIGILKGTAPNSAIVSLDLNNGGTLGTTLGSWAISNFPVFGTTSDIVITITGISGVQLNAGGSYFLDIVPTTPDAGTWAAWNENSPGTTGLVLTGCCGSKPDDTLGAFDVLGTVTATPLPAALPLFASGLGALGLLGWRRKKKAAAIAA